MITIKFIAYKKIGDGLLFFYIIHNIQCIMHIIIHNILYLRRECENKLVSWAYAQSIKGHK